MILLPGCPFAYEKDPTTGLVSRFRRVRATPDDCEQWHYDVSFGDVAVSFIVLSGLFLGTAPAPLGRYPRAVVLALHVGFPTTKDELAGRHKGVDCPYIDGGRDFNLCASSVHLAMDFMDEHFDKSLGPEQGEPFWTALEARLVKAAADVRPGRKDLDFERCSHCDGIGVVAKPEKVGS